MIKSIQNIQKNLNLKSVSYFGIQSRPGEIGIYERGGRRGVSGIRATIFGGTGFMGPYIGAILGYLGSDLVFPHQHKYNYDDFLKELKLCAATGRSQLVKCFQFENEPLLDRTVLNSNVVVNLVGPRRKIKTLSEAEHININIARRVAKACAKNPEIKRLIHFSAAGASPDSESVDLRTKYIAEQEVLSIFPNATIIRPCTIYGMNDYFVKSILIQRDFFHHFNIVTDDCTAKRQPIFCHDVAQSVLNALKLPETCGQTYELGGPHQYTRREIYEMIFNIIGRPPKLVYLEHKWATAAASTIGNWEHFSLETMKKDRIDLVVKPNAKTISDLYVQPVSFPQGVEQVINDLKGRFPGSRDLNER